MAKKNDPKADPRGHVPLPHQPLSVRIVLALIALIAFIFALVYKLTHQEGHQAPWDVLQLLHGSALHSSLINTALVDFSPRCGAFHGAAVQSHFSPLIKLRKRRKRIYMNALVKSGASCDG
jgi:hypothetical protein